MASHYIMCDGTNSLFDPPNNARLKKTNGSISFHTEFEHFYLRRMSPTKWLPFCSDLNELRQGRDITIANVPPGPLPILRPSYLRMAISMLKIRRPLGRLIFNMGIAIPGKTVFLIETAPSPRAGSERNAPIWPSRLEAWRTSSFYWSGHCSRRMSVICIATLPTPPSARVLGCVIHISKYIFNRCWNYCLFNGFNPHIEYGNIHIPPMMFLSSDVWWNKREKN